MSRPIEDFRIFVGSPSDLADERQWFRDVVRVVSSDLGKEDGISFSPVGWEDTIRGFIRPQPTINEDLSKCDFAVFLLGSRWGSPPPNSTYTSGFEEEIELAEKLQQSGEKPLQDMVIFLKRIDPNSLKDPDDQLKMVLAFRERLTLKGNHFFREFLGEKEFREYLQSQLISWLRNILYNRQKKALSLPRNIAASNQTPLPSLIGTSLEGNSDFWIKQATEILNGNSPYHQSSIIFSQRAIDAARTDSEWAKSVNTSGVALFHNYSSENRFMEAINRFDEVLERFQVTLDPDRMYWRARCLNNKAITLGHLELYDEALDLHNQIINELKKFGGGTITEVWADVVMAKAHLLNLMGRHSEALGEVLYVPYDIADVNDKKMRVKLGNFRLSRANCLLLGKRYDESIQEYEEIIQLYSTRIVDDRVISCSAMFSLILVYENREMFDISFPLFEKYSAMFKNDTSVRIRRDVATAHRNNLISMATNAASLEELLPAAKTFFELVKDSNDHVIQIEEVAAYLALGVCYRALGSSSKAILSFESVSRIYKDIPYFESKDSAAEARQMFGKAELFLAQMRR